MISKDLNYIKNTYTIKMNIQRMNYDFKRFKLH